MKALDPCYTCGDDFDSSPFVATFDGKPQHVCRDCAEGISNGSEILRANGVHGEHLDQRRNQ